MNKLTKVVIAGGGFAGVSAALELAKHANENVRVQLLTNRRHFEYHAALYRVVTGRSPMGVCVPLSQIFAGKDIEALDETVTAVDLQKNIVRGKSGSRYRYDYLILALGSETAYFDIPGLKTRSYGFKSIDEALALKRHLHEVFNECSTSANKDKVCATNIVVVGAGPSGVELAGELMVYGRELAQKHALDASLVGVQLVEAGPRVLPSLPQEVSDTAHRRLQQLGVNIFTNRPILEEKDNEVLLKDMEMKTDTVIWTAGVKANSFYRTIRGLKFDKTGRVAVDSLLRAKGTRRVFIIGDGAATKYSGMASTALYDGRFVARNIARAMRGEALAPYKPRQPAYSIPIGPRWAIAEAGYLRFHGLLGWWHRRLEDLKFFLQILPPMQAIDTFRNAKDLCESCEICSYDIS